MLEDLDIDDSGSPAIGLVPRCWPPGDDPRRPRGAYRTGTDMAVVKDLGPDQDDAIDEFRAYLTDHDET